MLSGRRPLPSGAPLSPYTVAATVPSLCPSEQRQLLPIAAGPCLYALSAPGAAPLGSPPPPVSPGAWFLGERLLGSGGSWATGAVRAPHWCPGFASARLLLWPRALCPLSEVTGSGQWTSCGHLSSLSAHSRWAVRSGIGPV